MVYVHRPANLGDFRAGEQWLEMMKATSLDEWRDAMRIQARTTSNFTYADRDGNIFYAWVSAAPRLPHPSGGDTLAILATRTDQVWTHLIPFDSLPQLLNPPGGYVRNENDSPHYTNMHQVLDPADFGPHAHPVCCSNGAYGQPLGNQYPGAPPSGQPGGSGQGQGQDALTSIGQKFEQYAGKAPAPVQKALDRFRKFL
jgi:hypothetical protein